MDTDSPSENPITASDEVKHFLNFDETGTLEKMDQYSQPTNISQYLYPGIAIIFTSIFVLLFVIQKTLKFGYKALIVLLYIVFILITIYFYKPDIV